MTKKKTKKTVVKKKASRKTSAKGKRKKRGSRRQKYEPPVVTSLILCDSIMVDQLTGKKSLTGLFDRFIIRHPGTPFRAFCVYSRMFGGNGDAFLQIAVVDPDGTRTALSEGDQVTLDRNTGIEGISRIGGLQFDQAGLYQFMTLSNGEQIGNAVPVQVIFLNRENDDNPE